MVAITHEQTIICSETRLDGTAHEQTIICGQLFAGHVVGCQPMEGKKKLHRMIINISIYTLSDLGVLSNLIGSLSLANEHYSPPTE